ncbi:alpha/beta hydrolase fold-domain-containing protein [Phascolomyces articulosus]|uniref:Alpha/beta hydrolase fold-domain-containing protein n=1 Tax=Phascolomyces articulosus TaxID=60185 RepID=A0AAD5JLU7_9FUNG|nr:alpha/beta hydrolase fold-domain-containing protein [Phascolomyces articulosus]
MTDTDKKPTKHRPMYPIYSELYEQMRNVPRPTNGSITPKEYRENMDKIISAALPLPEVIEEEKMIKYNGIAVKIYLYRPLGTENDILPAVIYYLGGGFVWGSKYTHGNPVHDICIKSHVAVVFVEYLMAPEFKYPTAHEESYAAYCWLLENGKEVNINPSKLVVCGDSAGGNLAATITLMAKERGTLDGIKSQILVYPWVANNTKEFDSFQEFGQGDYPLNIEDVEYYDKTYFAPKDKTRLAFPLMATEDELRGLPPTIVFTAETDVLRDEGEEYARKLIKADVSVASVRVIAAPHGFFSTPVETPCYKLTLNIIHGQLEIFGRQ